MFFHITPSFFHGNIQTLFQLIQFQIHSGIRLIQCKSFLHFLVRSLWLLFHIVICQCQIPVYRREIRVPASRFFIIRYGFAVRSPVIEQAAQIIIRHAKVVFCCQTLQHDIIFRSVREAAVGCSFFSQCHVHCHVTICLFRIFFPMQVLVSVSNIIIYQRINILLP